MRKLRNYFRRLSFIRRPARLRSLSQSSGQYIRGLYNHPKHRSRSREQQEVTMDIPIDQLQQMADRAGLGLNRQELEELKPIYDLYAAYAAQLHDIDFGAEEMVVEFHPDWPEA